MLVGLTRTQRQRAGWFVALAYLFCVLVPTIASALPGHHTPPHCLTGDNQVSGMVHVHHESLTPAHEGEHAHHHAGVQVSTVASHDAEMAAQKSDADPAKEPQLMDGKCCGLMCVTALPAALVAMAKPSVPKAARIFDSYRKLADNAPARLYRPPII